MKIIFLDIDVVLNTSETFVYQSKNYKQNGIYNVEIDEFRIGYLKEIIDKTESKVVLSSSWRYFFIKENDIVLPIKQKGLDLYNLLKKYDIEPIYDITTKQSMKREEQINLWLNDHNDVDSFIVIDDCTGLCKEHIEEAINILNTKTKVKRLKFEYNKKM